MATFLATGYNKPKFMPVTGAAYVWDDVAAVTTGLVLTDVIKFKIPAGVRITHVQVRPDDLDSNGTPLITFKTGYSAVDPDSSLTADDDYFAGTKTSMQSGSVLDCNFAPITFNEDINITLTIIASAATAVAGNVYVLVTGNAIGPA